MNRRLLLSVLAPVVLAVAAIAAAPAFAHGDTTPRHGGQVQLIGETMFELVAKPDGVEVYLVDDHEDAVAAEFTGKLKVLVGGATQDVALVSGEGNKFSAPGLKLASGARAIVTVKRNSTGASFSARFTIG